MTRPHLHIVRPFNWGLLLLGDQGTSELPARPPTAPDIASVTPSAIALRVRHSQDTDQEDEPAAVTIDVFVDVEPDGATDFATDLDIASGVFEVGDADGSEQLEIGADLWNIALIAIPADHPDTITIWLNRHASPATGSSSSRHPGASSG